MAFMAQCTLPNGLSNISTPTLATCFYSMWPRYCLSRGDIYLFTPWIWVCVTPRKIWFCVSSRNRPSLAWKLLLQPLGTQPLCWEMSKPHGKTSCRQPRLHHSGAPSPQQLSTASYVSEPHWRSQPTRAPAVCQQHMEQRVHSAVPSQLSEPWAKEDDCCFKPLSFRGTVTQEEITGPGLLDPIRNRARWEGLQSHSVTYVADFILDLSDMQQHGRVVDGGVASGPGLVVFQLIKYLNEMEKHKTTFCIFIYNVM